jgi:hypothetical protein
VVPAAALLASAEVLGVDIGQLVEATRESVREKIADLEALVATAPSDRSNNGAQLSNRIELSKGRATTKR